jgi:hypothetical protein
MKTALLLLLSVILAGCNKRQHFIKESLSDALYGFENIQDSARTKTWWFHGETETTKEGITADLEAFKTAGVGGVVYYDQTHGKMENALPAFSPEWWEMLRFSSEEAKRLGLSFELHISNGFVAGGPWITYEYGMKRLAATERLVPGGQHFEGRLEVPLNRHSFSRDVAVLAFPAPQGGGISSLTEPVRLSSNMDNLDLDNIFDPVSDKPALIPAPGSGKSVYLALAFEEDFTARSISYEVRPRGMATTSATNIPQPPQETFTGTGYRILPDLGQLEVSDDGINYRPVCNLKPVYRAHENWRQKTISFPAVTGKYFRLNLHDWWEENDRNPDTQLARVVLNSAAKLDQWEEKAAFYSEYIENDRTPAYSAMEAIDASRILDITDKMDADGVLRWEVPEGDWLVMRFACVPTGGRTKHGRTNLMGLECDKLSKEAVTVQWNNYVARMLDSLKTTGSGHVSGVVMDSHEAGAQNWTDHFIGEFTQRRGYDPTLYLPAMMGYVISDVTTSNGFLFDIRRNIADMLTDNYYGTVESLCDQSGLTFTAQAIGNALCIVGDPIQAKSKVAKPQGEFWGIHPNGNYDIKESSSAAHLYGKRIASAEAYTDIKFSASLADIKSLADYAYAFGINEFAICASAYQPWLDKFPGSTGGGRHYAITRNNTYWDYSGPFWDFQARNAHIMRQGKPAIDLCVYLGENAPVKILTYRLPEIPGGFDFDAFTSDALFTRMSARNGRIALPDGTGYNMMILPRSGDITLDALQKIAEMVKQGIRVYGPKPSHSGSGRDLGKEAEYSRIANDLWGENPASQGARSYGKGSVYWGMPLEKAVELAGIIPDIRMKQGNTRQSMIYFAHRQLNDADVYFLNNHKDQAEDNIFTFAAGGKYAQLWNTATGNRYSLPVLESDNGTTSVKLYFHPRESYFVMITDHEEPLPPVLWITPADKTEVVEGSWTVWFSEKLGGPGAVTFDKLDDWTAHADPRIRYYSGTAVYKKDITVSVGNDRICLDLGNPGFVARVFVNSQEVGIVWCSPWMVDITRYLTNGENELEIHVANSLMNRMVYDESLPVLERITYSYPAIVSSTDALEPSGLKQVRLVRKTP